MSGGYPASSPSRQPHLPLNSTVRARHNSRSTEWLVVTSVCFERHRLPSVTKQSVNRASDEQVRRLSYVSRVEMQWPSIVSS